MKINLKFLKRISVIKTLRINIKYFPLRTALKVPIILTRNVYLKKLKGKVVIKGSIKTAQIRIGFMDTSLSTGKEKCVLNIEGLIEFNGRAKIGAGSKIAVGPNGRLIFGNNFKITSNTSIACFKEIEFGKDCLLSWDILIMDTDAHTIFNSDREKINYDKKIEIGNRVWIGTRSMILKGAKIPSNCVIGANSLIASEYCQSNSIILGNPSKIIKNEITWG